MKEERKEKEQNERKNKEKRRIEPNSTGQQA
jgi:hypothetical protein